MARVTVYEGTLTDIADAIRYRAGNEDTYKPGDMAAAIMNISSGGSADSFVEKTLTEYTNANATQIWGYTFYRCTKLATVYLPNITSIGENAFYFCSSLDIDNTTAFPKVASIGSNAFGYSALDSFTGNSSLTTLSDRAFANATLLKTVDLKDSNVTEIQYSTFNGCSKLEYVDLGDKITLIDDMAFYYCSSLKTVIIRTNYVPELSTSYVFGSSGITKNIGYIYVHKDILEDYQTATGWSGYSSQLRAIEDYPEICGEV